MPNRIRSRWRDGVRESRTVEFVELAHDGRPWDSLMKTPTDRVGANQVTYWILSARKGGRFSTSDRAAVERISAAVDANRNYFRFEGGDEGVGGRNLLRVTLLEGEPPEEI